MRSRASQPGVLIRLAPGRHPAADNEADSRGRRSPGHSGKKSRRSSGFSFSAELKPPHLSFELGLKTFKNRQRETGGGEKKKKEVGTGRGRRRSGGRSAKKFNDNKKGTHKKKLSPLLKPNVIVFSKGNQ